MIIIHKNPLKKFVLLLKKNGEIILWVYKKPALIRVLMDNYFREKIQKRKNLKMLKIYCQILQNLDIY